MPSTSTLSESRAQTFSLLILASVALTMTLVYTKSILIPFLFSFFFYSATLPLIKLLVERLKLPRIVAIILALILFVITITGLFSLIVSSVGEFAEGVPAYRSRLLAFTDTVTGWAKLGGVTLDSQLIKNELRELVSPSVIQGITGKAIGIVGHLFLITIFFLFLILGGESKSKKTLIHEIQGKISVYVTQKTLLSVATGLLTGVILLAFNVDLAFMFIILTILLNFIPSVGSMIAVLLPLPVIFLQFGLGWQMIAILALCSLVQVVIGNVIEPKMMGDTMDLHPITILIFLMFWGLVWGVPGMFLAVPITAILKIVLSRIEPTKKLAEVLAGRLYSKA